MTQEPVHSFTNASLALGAAEGAHAKGASRHAPVTQVKPSPLALRLSTPGVQIIDQVTVLTAYALTRVEAPARQGQAVATYLAMSISVRHLLMAAGLILLCRAVFWFMGMYQPHINRRAAVFLWKVPLAMLLCTGTLVPLCWSRGYSASPRELGLFWFSASVLLLTARTSVLTYEESIRPLFRLCGQ